MHNASTKKVPPESAAATVGLSVLLEYEVLVWALGLFAFHGVVQFACSRVQSPLQAKPGVVAHQAAILPAFLFAAVRGTTAFLAATTTCGHWREAPTPTASTACTPKASR